MHDFLKRIDCDYVVQVNTTSPFITENDISSVINLLINQGYDTVQSIKIEQIEGLYEEKPINFIAKHKMPQSQDLKPYNGSAYGATTTNFRLVFCVHCGQIYYLNGRDEPIKIDCVMDWSHE